jgi:hypothetical protein
MFAALIFKFWMEEKQSDENKTNKDLMRRHCRRVIFSVLTSAVGIFYLAVIYTFNSARGPFDKTL